MINFILIISLLINIIFYCVIFQGAKFIDGSGNKAWTCKKVKHENYYNKD